MVFPSLWNNQAFKNNRGYYLNHDALAAANPETRKRLILYFMLEQTPKKLPQDTIAEYTRLRQIYTLPLKGLLFTGLVLAQRNFTRLSTPFINRMGMDAMQVVGRLVLSMWFANMVGDSVAEPILIGSSRFGEITKKIQPTIYDFHQSKRDSVLEATRREMAKQMDSYLGFDQI